MQNNLFGDKAIVIKCDKGATLSRWKYCCSIPFALSDDDIVYSVTYVMEKKGKRYGYCIKGKIEELFLRIEEKIASADVLYIVIADENKEKEYWCIKR